MIVFFLRYNSIQNHSFAVLLNSFVDSLYHYLELLSCTSGSKVVSTILNEITPVVGFAQVVDILALIWFIFSFCFSFFPVWGCNWLVYAVIIYYFVRLLQYVDPTILNTSFSIYFSLWKALVWFEWCSPVWWYVVPSSCSSICVTTYYSSGSDMWYPLRVFLSVPLLSSLVAISAGTWAHYNHSHMYSFWFVVSLVLTFWA